MSIVTFVCRAEQKRSDELEKQLSRVYIVNRGRTSRVKFGMDDEGDRSSR